MYSFWEREAWFKNIDFAIIGSGIVGLNCALELRKKHPKSRIVIFEKGPLPSGASSKNAGFACFGSPTELKADLKSMSENEVYDLVELRLRGLEKLKTICGTNNIDYQENGSYEVFQKQDKETFFKTIDSLPQLNKLLYPIFKQDCFSNFTNQQNLGFNNISGVIHNKFEGQIDTGKMIKTLINIAVESNIELINGITIEKFTNSKNSVLLESNNNFIISCSQLFIASNGFAKELLPDYDIRPARAQVLITKQIPNLHLKGTFHMDEGFYYFRNFNNRILFGGGRNLDIKGEETSAIDLSMTIQNKLDELLENVILPNTSYEVDMRWAGIMGVGNTKKPILKEVQSNVFCGIRMGGMGVAIGSIIGEKLAQLSFK
jgi:glycine/D-amino acid oxidase-like deaminating enzyme